MPEGRTLADLKARLALLEKCYEKAGVPLMAPLFEAVTLPINESVNEGDEYHVATRRAIVDENDAPFLNLYGRSRFPKEQIWDDQKMAAEILSLQQDFLGGLLPIRDKVIKDCDVIMRDLYIRGGYDPLADLAEGTAEELEEREARLKCILRSRYPEQRDE